MHKLSYFFNALHSEKIEIKRYSLDAKTINEIVTQYLGVKELSIFGDYIAICANGKQVIGDASVIDKVYIEVFFCLSAPDSFERSPNIADVWQENHLKVIFKPPYLSTQPSRTPFLPSLKNFISRHSHIPSRLDFGVGGLILISENPRYHKFVHNLYATGKIAKIYIFASFNKSIWELKYVQTDITQSSFHPALRKTVEGSAAKSVFFFLFTLDDKHFYAVRIYTGKTHQVRLHASYLGIPIIGDPFYGLREENRLHLLCYCLRFQYCSETVNVKVPVNLLPNWLPPSIIHRLDERLDFFINLVC